ncbi:TPA: ead/Ea22-like family protein [Citrobacter koseri]|uniref:hypothetical protein n=1 Tax=Citrobacter koseri TaxID=545 RepID=UPI00277BFC92|nr:ead/Ea22-like family protein [Citrobacter koseri]HDW1087365.1 ead/Ea22-like family protein [Citrobacter koseri]HDZ7990129.1 ead/Ea22-like family protein [Citrobacter koseri]
MTDKQALREAAEKYRTTYAAHLKNPRNYDALDAWDKATSEFMALVNNDELNIIASLIDEIDMETGYREGAFVACNRWHTKFRETEAKLEAADNTAAQLNNELCNLLPGVQYMDPPDGGSVTPIEQVRRMVVDYREQMEAAEKRMAELREWNAGLAQESFERQQRIAELEERTPTVKMPEPFKLAKSSSGLTYYYADEVDKALDAASINVEAE